MGRRDSAADTGHRQCRLWMVSCLLTKRKLFTSVLHSHRLSGAELRSPASFTWRRARVRPARSETEMAKLG